MQFIDVLWAIFIWLGIERARVAPGITAASPLDLFYMPYTHSLVAALLWSVAAYAFFRFRGAPAAAAVAVAAAVFSHWILDLVSHRPDLPIYDNTMKVGLNLWNHAAATYVTEAALVLAGAWVYGKRNMRVAALVLLLLLVQAASFFGPQPSSIQAVAVTAEVSYLVFAALAFWVDRPHSV